MDRARQGAQKHGKVNVIRVHGGIVIKEGGVDRL